MAVPVKKTTSAVIHLVANGTTVIAGNSTVSNVALTGQNVSQGAIRQIYHGAAPSGYWMVKRGSNTVAVLEGTGHQNYAGMSLPLTTDAAANVVVELVGTGNGYIMIEVSKELIP